MAITFFYFLLSMLCNFFLTTNQVDLVLFIRRAALDRFVEESAVVAGLMDITKTCCGPAPAN